MNFLSVDLEDWHTSAYLRDYVTTKNYSSRIEVTTELILNSFDKHQVKATFFILGSIAKEHPQLIKRIAKNGHEIASHGYSHTPLWDLNPDSFQKEIQETTKILADLTGQRPIGFRAPYASLRQDTSWSIDILKSEGFKYDSSIFPMKTPLYGVKNAPTEIYKISAANICVNDDDSSLVEIPFSVYKTKLFSIPCTGGIYARFLPLFMLKYLLRSLEKKGPLNFYFHPWEIDADIPKIKTPLYNNLVSYYNVSQHMTKINSLISSFDFQPLNSIIES